MTALKSVGRLDRDSSGLLVLTDDGMYAHQHLHPSFTKTKRYTVKLSKPLSETDAALLQSGVELDDGLSRLQLKDIDGRAMTVILHEGRNRQIRRSFSALGYRVVQLHRTNFGSLKLGELEPGEYRELTKAELSYA
jgi:pseudouridine synthase